MKLKKAVLLGMLNGLIGGIVSQIYLILFWLNITNNNIEIYSSGLLVAIIVFFIFKKQSFKHLFHSVTISIITYIITTIILLKTVNIFLFKCINGINVEISPGAGIVIVFLLIVNFLGSVVGLVMAIICIFINYKKKQKDIVSNEK